MRIAFISCAIAASITMASLARADGDEAPSTWMLQPSPYDPPTSTTQGTTSTGATETKTDATAETKTEEVGGATVSFAVRNENGEDIKHARVLMDGQILTGALDGWAVTVPPGEHVFEFAAAGYVAEEHTVTIHAGVVAELLTVSLAPVELAYDYTLTTPPVIKRPPIYDPLADDYTTPAKSPSDPWIVTYVAGGTSLVALAVGTAFGVAASNQISDLRQTCAPSCSDSDVSSASAKMTAADVAFGVAIVSGTVAVVWAVTHPREPAHETKSAVGFTVRGLSGQF
jgi:hypothetical protein